ncbi:radical SAM protein [Acanthopleuribacter pedis]|uniref:Radical SAM protein n=1 Tax=Acanthopleuribacter pedis TaxID=442870 RepID=A0A8J7U4T9_9BACT|nr:radical SAM protein [Acanthopleuribacter pedis]MBO1317344.1 radical SAM protein [Acanthopleuribacter pedis]MBO1318651.1 radical SAM protein [Acanthopleuribacter pedis]
MNASTPLDCILVGYNDIDFNDFSARQKATEHRAGGYHEVKTNSILQDGRRVTFMEVLNDMIVEATGNDPKLNVFEAPALGAHYLCSYLNTRGLNVDLVNFFNRDQAKFAALLAGKPRTVAITTTFYIDNSPIREIVAFIREHAPDTQIIIGGPHIYNVHADLQNDWETLSFVLKETGGDVYIIDSQGEETLYQTLVALRDGNDLAGVNNLAYRADDESFSPTERKIENNDLNSNIVDWTTFDPNALRPLTYLRTARSCPYSCSFCQYPVLAGPHVVNDIEAIQTQLTYLHEIGTTDLVFIDDTFNVPLPRFKKLLRMMIENQFNFRWVSFLRVANVDEEAIDLMADSGCVGVLLGIESGDPTILKIMNKRADVDRYKWGISQLKRRGIMSYASLICGFPGESKETILNTIHFIEEAAPTFFNVQLYFHDTSAPIHRRHAEFDLKGAGYSWSHAGMNWEEAMDWAKYMYQSIGNSTFISLYGFSLWGISYLVSKGLTPDQLISFGKITKPLLFDSLTDRPSDLETVRPALMEVFKTNCWEDPADAEGKAFWEKVLQDTPAPLRLPQNAVAGTQGRGKVDVHFPDSIFAGLRNWATEKDTTVWIVCHTLFKVFLFQLTKQQSFTTGLAMADKVMPVRVDLSGALDVEDLLNQVITATRSGWRYQDSLPAHTATPNVLFTNRTDFKDDFFGDIDLALIAYRTKKDAFHLALNYDATRFQQQTIEGYLAALQRFSHMIAGRHIAA